MKLIESVNLFRDISLPESILTQKEIAQLFKRFKDGEKDVLDEIAIHNIKLALSIAKKYCLKYKYEFDELLSIALLGLLKAIKQYDFEKGTKFSTCATKYIQTELNVYINKEANYQNNTYSLNICTPFGKEETTYLELIQDDSLSIEEQLTQNLLDNTLSESLEQLDEKNLEIFKDLFQIDRDDWLNLTEAGKKHGLTFQRVGQIKNKTLKIIKNYCVKHLNIPYPTTTKNINNKHTYKTTDYLLLDTLFTNPEQLKVYREFLGLNDGIPKDFYGVSKEVNKSLKQVIYHIARARQTIIETNNPTLIELVKGLDHDLDVETFTEEEIKS